MAQLGHWLAYPPHQRRAAFVAAATVLMIVLLVCMIGWLTPQRAGSTPALSLPPPLPAPTRSAPAIAARPAVVPPPDWFTPHQELATPSPTSAAQAPPTVVLAAPPDWSPTDQPNTSDTTQPPATTPTPPVAHVVISSHPHKPTTARQHRLGHSPTRWRSTTSRPRTQTRSAPPVPDPPAVSSPAAAGPRAPVADSPEPVSIAPAPTAQALPAPAPQPSTTYSRTAAARPDNSPLTTDSSGGASTYAPSTQVETPHTVSDPVNGSDQDFDRSIDNIIDQEMQRYGQGGGN